MITGLEVFEILKALGYSWARMAISLIFSILFSLCVGISAGVNRTAEKILIPILDVFQSIPILSFFPLALFIFIGIHPIIGPEIAAIFLIFTSQVWNIAFGVYEAIKLIPPEILEASRSLGLGKIRKLVDLYIPAAFPKIASNLPASWANGLYFLVACEIITIGESKWRLLGIGTLSTEFMLSGRILEFWISLGAVLIAVVIMNLFLFIPLMRLSERYKFEIYATEVPRVWIEKVTRPIGEAFRRAFASLSSPRYEAAASSLAPLTAKLKKYRKPVLALVASICLIMILHGLSSSSSLEEFAALIKGFEKLGLVDPLIMIGFSLSRVAAAIVIGLAWVIPVTILMHEKRVLEKILVPTFQVLASLPATLLIPLIVKLVLDLKLTLEVGSIALILLGTQWYLFFFISGALRDIPREEEELCMALKITGLKKLRHLYLPRALPSLVMGCLVAMGGGWNTLVVAERIVLDHFTWEVENPGIGKALSEAVSLGDLSAIVTVTIWMAGFIVVLNRLFWRRLYEKAAEFVGAAV